MLERIVRRIAHIAPLGLSWLWRGASTLAALAGRATTRLAAVGLRVAQVVLLVTAALLIIVQPFRDRVDLDALVAIAGLLATVLSLGLTVTLLVAQHTAERHARMLYAEFRRERAWLMVLASLAVGVVAIVAASLAAATMSTAWAALAVAVSLGLFAASLLPRLLDSLDRTELARRITDRIVHQLRDIGRRVHPTQREEALKPVARRGVDIAGAMTVEGLSTNDVEVVRSGFAGIRRVLIAYLAGSPTRGWDTEVINYAFQHLGVATELLVKQSPVLILPAAIEELTILGVESPTVLQQYDQYENVSGHLNGLFLEIVSQTLTADESAAAAMATAGIGEGGVALIQAQRPTGVTDHIRRLSAISGASLSAERDHVAGQAHHELARLALGVALMNSRDIMPESLYHDACEAVSLAIARFVTRTTTAGSLMRDIAMTPINGPLAEPNLSRVIIAGLFAEHRARDKYGSRFAFGADVLVRSLLRLSTYGTSVVMTPSYARDTAYSAVLGGLALELDAGSSELVPRWWLDLVRQLVDPADRNYLHDEEMLSTLLLVAVYEAESSRPAAAKMREALLEALSLTGVITDDFQRRRRARSWLLAGRAAAGSGDADLAAAISAAIAKDLRDIRVALDARPWADPEGLAVSFGGDLYPPVPGTPVRIPLDLHHRPDVIADFDALLDRHDRQRPQPRRPYRRRKKEPPST